MQIFRNSCRLPALYLFRSQDEVSHFVQFLDRPVENIDKPAPLHGRILRQMKKSALASLLLASMIGDAYGQSNVTLYGVIDMGLKVENAGIGTELGLVGGGHSGSRVGFQGTEDLGGSLRANFVLEAGFKADSGAQSAPGILFNRQSYVSLAGDLGEVKLGRTYTVFCSTSAIFDPFADGLAGDSARIFNYGGYRTNNTVNYSFTAKNGINGQAAYSFGEVAGNSNANRTISGSIGYAAGPLATVLTYQSTQDLTGSDSAKTLLLGGNYNFGLFHPFFAYAINKGVGALNTQDALLGLQVHLTPTDILMMSAMHKYDKVTKHSDATQLAFGYTHDLSKRTNLYTSWSRLTNGYSASYHVSANGKADNLFNAGIRHKF